METRRLGRSGLEITTIGFGAWGVGGRLGSGDRAGGWAGQADEDSVAAIRAALDAGVNWIDTAPIYGAGHSEEVVGRALDGLAERPPVFTKCGLTYEEGRGGVFSLRAGTVRAEVEKSLRRLRADVLDLVQIHWPNPEEEIEEGWSTLADLRREGVVRHIGVSNFSPQQMERCNAIAPVESDQPPYSLLDRAAEADVLPYCEREDVGVVAWGPLAHGLLTGTWTRERVDALPEDDFRSSNNTHFSRPAVYGNLERVERLKAVAARLGRPPAEVAAAWTLRSPAVTGAIVGFRKPEQVGGVVGASGLRLDDEALAELDAAFPAQATEALA